MVVCGLWTGLLVLLYCWLYSGIDGKTELTVVMFCSMAIPWVIGAVVPVMWRYIVYGSPRRRYYY